MSNKENDLSTISQSDKQEDDSRIILHLSHTVSKGYKNAFIRTVDSNLLIIHFHYIFCLHKNGLIKLWIGFDKRKNKKIYPFSKLPINKLLTFVWLLFFPCLDRM